MEERSIMSERLHRVGDMKPVKSYRLLPYSEIVEILREDGTAFFEDSREQPLKRGTIWKAARNLSEMMKEPVTAQRVVMRLKSGADMAGYLFSASSPRSRSRRSKRV